MTTPRMSEADYAEYLAQLPPDHRAMMEDVEQQRRLRAKALADPNHYYNRPREKLDYLVSWVTSNSWLEGPGLDYYGTLRGQKCLRKASC